MLNEDKPQERIYGKIMENIEILDRFIKRNLDNIKNAIKFLFEQKYECDDQLKCDRINRKIQSVKIRVTTKLGEYQDIMTFINEKEQEERQKEEERRREIEGQGNKNTTNIENPIIFTHDQTPSLDDNIPTMRETNPIKNNAFLDNDVFFPINDRNTDTPFKIRKRRSSQEEKNSKRSMVNKTMRQKIREKEEAKIKRIRLEEEAKIEGLRLEEEAKIEKIREKEEAKQILEKMANKAPPSIKPPRPYTPYDNLGGSLNRYYKRTKRINKTKRHRRRKTHHRRK